MPHPLGMMADKIYFDCATSRHFPPLVFFVPLLIPFDGLSVPGHFYVHRGACTHGPKLS